MEFIEKLRDFFIGTGVSYARNLTFVILFFLATRVVITLLKTSVNKQTMVDRTIPNFVISILNIALIIIWVLFVLRSLFDISTDSIITVLSIFTLGLSLALQDVIVSLANGVLIIVNKPFVEGEFIQVQNTLGTVTKISLFNTTLKCYDGNMITVPNSALITNNVTNYSRLPTRRLDISLPISYKVKVSEVEAVMKELFAEQTNILKDPAPCLLVDSYGESNVNYIVRVWTPSDKYWDVRFEMNAKILTSLEKANIKIDYAQIDVHFEGKEGM